MRQYRNYGEEIEIDTSNDPGLICAYRIREDGTSARLTWDDIDRTEPQPDSFVWLHLDQTEARAEEWVTEESGLGPIDAEAMLAEETRPRFTRLEESALLNLRGVNLNPGAEAEDMVSLRAWIEPGRIITIQRRPLRAIADISARVEAGSRIRSAAGLAANLAENLVDRIGGIVEELDDQLDVLEDRIADAPDIQARADLRQLRRRASHLRRFIAPQRDALTQFAGSDAPWLTERARRRVQEVANDITRLVEALGAVWERAAILQDEVSAQLSEQANRRLYILSIVAAIFLPLGFVAGLLGVNLAGIPGSAHPAGFVILCAGLVAMSGFLVWLFRHFKWF